MALGIDAFSRRSLAEPSVKPLALFLRSKLKSKLGATDDDIKEKWLSSAFKMPVYDISINLTRLMMLAAFNDTCPSSDEVGMIEKSPLVHL